MTRRTDDQRRSAVYKTYLLTCWQERDEVAETATWRFRLETSGSGDRRLFTNLEQVLGAISEELRLQKPSH